jgi:hypothetical protein
MYVVTVVTAFRIRSKSLCNQTIVSLGFFKIYKHGMEARNVADPLPTSILDVT